MPLNTLTLATDGALQFITPDIITVDGGTPISGTIGAISGDASIPALTGSGTVNKKLSGGQARGLRGRGANKGVKGRGRVC